MASSKKFDIVIFGATGFTGRLAAQYVAKQYGNTIKWAIAGRAPNKLEAIRSDCQGIPEILIADSADQSTIEAMVAQTKVVVTFAGPFSRYGSGLVAACAAAGTDYCDITGETDWVREMIAVHDDTAKKNGARIVSLCGHDSLPWDIVTFMLVKKLREKNSDAELARVEMWDKIRSAPSGGTLETAFDIMFGKKKPKAEEVKALGYDPLLKLPAGETGPSTFKVTPKNVGSLEKANPSKLHTATRTMFFMAGVNANAVKRSNALNGYGSKVVYCEGQEWGSLFKACKYLFGMFWFGLGLCIPPIRWLMRKFVLPKPGDGPSEASMEKGFLVVTGVATATDGSTAKASLSFSVDPGYKDTARMAIESALALVEEKKDPLHNANGGVFTPGCCQGEAVLNRLLKTGSTFLYH